MFSIQLYQESERNLTSRNGRAEGVNTTIFKAINVNVIASNYSIN